MPMEEPVVRPGDLALDELRRIGSGVVDAIAEYHDGLDGRPVLPRVTPAEVAASFSGRLPAEGEPAETLISARRSCALRSRGRENCCASLTLRRNALAER